MRAASMKQRCSHLDGFCKCYSDSINEGCAQTINPSWRPSEFWKPLWNFGNLSGFGSRLGGEQAHGGFKEESLGESELAPQHVSKPLKLRASDGTRYNMVYHGSTWFGLAYHGVIWFSEVSHGLAMFNMV